MKKTGKAAITEAEFRKRHAEIGRRVKEMKAKLKEVSAAAKEIARAAERLRADGDSLYFDDEAGVRPSFKKLPDMMFRLESWIDVRFGVHNLIRDL